jgi:hypothetical protein
MRVDSEGAVSTTYDFLLQPVEPGAALPVEPISAALGDRGARRRADGAWLWTFPRGEVVGLPVREGGQVVAFELKVPLKDTTELVGAVLRAAAEVADALGLRLLDPQLSRPVKFDHEDVVGEAYLRCARYAGEYLGVADALGASSLGAPPADTSGLGLRVALALVVFIAVALLTLRALS